jgi:guanine deaminase
MAVIEPGLQLIQGARIVDAGAPRGVEADLLISDGVIQVIGPNLAAPPGTPVIDATHCLLHPGLINAHTHGHGALTKGLGDRWTLEMLLAAGPWFGGGRQMQDRRLGTLLCAAEMALKGCTAAYDLTGELPLPTVEGFDACAEAYAQVGMRAVLAPMVADLTLYQAIPGLFDALPPALQARVDALRLAPGEATLAAMRQILRGWRWAGQGIGLALAPTIPLHCTDAFMTGCAALAREYGARLHSHVGESRVQAVTGISRYGRTLLGHMDALGLVDEKFTVAHGIWLDDDDFRLLADRGGSIAHNPGSNMKLGNGIARLRAMLDAGLTVGIGTDGPGSADNQNMYESMREAARLSRTTPDPRGWVSSEEAFRAATEGSAAALGFEKCGRIAEGFNADIVFLDLGAINWLPHNHSINQLVHVEDGLAVRHVMAAGRFIVRDRVLTGVDLARLGREAEAARDRLEAATADAKALFENLSPIVASFCPGLAAVPYQVRRYLDSPPGF